MTQSDKIVQFKPACAPDERAVRQAILGDRQAFCALIREYEPMMYRMAWSMLYSDADCCDAVQEAIFKAWRALDKLREPQWFKTWLMRILINECKQLLRRRGRFLEMPDREPAAPARALDDALDVRRALKLLPESQRAPVMLFYYEDFSLEMIARALRLPLGTIKSRLYAARKQLRKLLEVGE